MQNGSSVGIHIHCLHVFARLAPICMLSQWFINEISASELSRKLIKSASLVGSLSVHSTILFFFPPQEVLLTFRLERKKHGILLRSFSFSILPLLPDEKSASNWPWEPANLMLRLTLGSLLKKTFGLS